MKALIASYYLVTENHPQPPTKQFLFRWAIEGATNDDDALRRARSRSLGAPNRKVRSASFMPEGSGHAIIVYVKET